MKWKTISKNCIPNAKLRPYKKIAFYNKNVNTLKLQMEGEQIPKATMNNFIKARLKVSFSADFANKFLTLAKDYINRLTEEANEICTKNDKKTINAEHIESALINFGLQHQLKQLKDMSSLIKQQNQIKQEFRQRIQENIQKNLQQIEGEDEGPRVVSIKEDIGGMEIHNQQDSEDIDYEAQMEAEEPKPAEKKGKKKGGKQTIQQSEEEDQSSSN